MNARRWMRLWMPCALFACLAPVHAHAADVPTTPVSFNLGGAEFTPGGYFEMSAVYRGTNTGSALATAFGSIPYPDTPAGNLSEFRLTAQQSRLNLRIADTIGDTKLTAFGEVDWAGNSASNVWVTSNSQTLRMRQYWANVDFGEWEFLAGQAYSWLTPNREGLSSDPRDLMVTRNVDGNTNVGLPWTRAGQFRVAYHAGEDLGFGVALENPEQYVGVNEVTYPAAFSALLGTQFDAGNNAATPNYQPDLVAKAAWDGLTGIGNLHLEAVGIARTFRATDAPAGTTYQHHSANGSGIGGAATISLGEHCRLTGSGLQGTGIGRYMGGLGPDVVVRPTGALPSFDLELSTVKANSWLLGIEGEPTSLDKLAAYFGRTDFDPNSFPDITAPGPVKPIIGFGGANSTTSANLSLRELTVDASHAFWSSADHGAFELLGQYSRVERVPCFVPPGGQSKALVDMAYVSVRYTLP